MTASASKKPSVPRVGMPATARNRRGVIAAVEPFDGDSRLHLVQLDYLDDQAPAEERLLWELEPGAALLEPAALPDPARPPMPPSEFDALLRAARWTALSPYLDPDGDGPLDREPLASPLHGGVRIEDYQLAPLLKALRMPRVSLLIADDVGLGKTVEAGLILTELLLRRRIRRILVLTPASLRGQWKEELREKFALRFEVVDRRSTQRLRRTLGMDANPWRSFDRIVASYHYLRQPDIREQFLAACRTPEGSPRLPWDLLIVDECHHLMPAPLGDDSELCRTLRLVAPRFEHRLFLSATPHNGHTGSFTGLLEILDPVRFAQTNEMNPAMRNRVSDLVVRRLKRDIGARGGAPRFCRRKPPEALQLSMESRETALSAAFGEFRKALRGVAQAWRGRGRTGAFAVEVLGKRLLSCPVAFAESWRRALEGFAGQEPAAERELAAAERALRRETGDDREAEQREATAATVTGAWLKNFAEPLAAEIDRIGLALADLGFDLDSAPTVEQTPVADARFDTLTQLIDARLRSNGRFRDDERLIVFTEYKTTLDYLARRLRERYPADRVLTLFGAGGPEGMTDPDRESVKDAFNDPGAEVRVLVATDAASEGLNLHRTARYLLHYDCPWNPSRLEQRNGRLDRYGQGREVSVYHFLSDADADLGFLAGLVRKAHEIREDLGSVNEMFDRAVHRRLIRGEDPSLVRAELDRTLEEAKGRAEIPADTEVGVGAGDLATEIGFGPAALAATLEAAMGAAAGPPLQSAGSPGVYRVSNPGLPGWREVLDRDVRLSPNGNGVGPLPQLAFSAEPFLERRGALEVFRPRREMQLCHLGHPLIRRALAVLARRRYPGAGAEVSRWTMRRGGLGAETGGAEAILLLSIEEFAVNELRETFHRWVRTVAWPVRNGELGAPLAPAVARTIGSAPAAYDPADENLASDILGSVVPALRRRLRQRREDLSDAIGRQLRRDLEAAKERENERYQQRRAELSNLIATRTLERLERELAKLDSDRRRGWLFHQEERLAEVERSQEEKQKELDRIRGRYEELREQLGTEHARIVGRLLPGRHALAGEVQAFPVTVEVRLPG